MGHAWAAGPTPKALSARAAQVSLDGPAPASTTIRDAPRTPQRLCKPPEWPSKGIHMPPRARQAPPPYMALHYPPSTDTNGIMLAPLGSIPRRTNYRAVGGLQSHARTWGVLRLKAWLFPPQKSKSAHPRGRSAQRGGATTASCPPHRWTRVGEGGGDADVKGAAARRHPNQNANLWFTPRGVVGA